MNGNNLIGIFFSLFIGVLGGLVLSSCPATTPYMGAYAKGFTNGIETQRCLDRGGSTLNADGKCVLITTVGSQ